MATTFGPERPVDTMPIIDDATAHHLPLPLSVEDTSTSHSNITTPQPSPRNLPLPNPPFVFPARPSSASAPSSYSRATGRRPRSAIETQERPFGMGIEIDRTFKSPPLPDFSFNPGASLPAENPALLSPPLSPQSPRLIPSPSRPPASHGHRRGGSEFVGGHLRAGEAIQVMSTSPTKPESGFASPTFQPPPVTRRGHAHRRSAAISSHDLTLILQPSSTNAALRGSSAPTSPAEFDRGHSPALLVLEKTLKPVESEPILKKPGTPDNSPLEASSPNETTPQPAKPVPRARVGFSDTLEFIPRPLSLVSSDTSSTMTARPGHSVSGSISSIISLTTSTIAERELIAPLSPASSRKKIDSRPSTASAVLERTQSIQSVELSNSSPRRRNSIPTLISIPDSSAAGPAAPSPSKVPKRWSFFGFDSFTGANSPVRSRPASSSSTESAIKLSDSGSSSEHIPDTTLDDTHTCEPAQKKNSRKPKSKKKVKNWAGSILTRKPKQRSKKNKNGPQRSPTPPSPGAEPKEPTADEVNTPIEPVTPTVTVTESTSPPRHAESRQQPLQRPVSAPEDDSSYPMIDLDAALGPFNTPLPNNPEWEAAQKAAGHCKRQLHSAQGLKGFSGPGMHYHRRAESAPEMVPFEGGRFGIHRFGSSSTMADVFEEDEEDDSDSKKDSSDSDDAEEQVVEKAENQPVEDIGIDATPPTNSVPDASPPAANDSPILPNAIRRIGSDLSHSDRGRPTASMKSERSTTSLRDDVIAETTCGVEFRTTSMFQDNYEMSQSTQPSRRALACRDLAPVDVSPLHVLNATHAPISPYSMSHASSFPSPRSPMSYDAQRISTAPSSVNDENNFQSLLMGEPGPEVRISVDDIPSLTSSNSTMTRDSTFIPNAQPTFREQRPASVSSAAFGRRRSSLASLSRLISSSHGERSKLSMEVSFDTESEKRPKASKAKRLSRMMQFWKSKESASH
jgi:hypothetical protein